MEITIFAKKRNPEGRPSFYSYLTRLHKKDGTELPATVKFRDGVPQPSPSDCPMNIVFTSKEGSLSPRTYTDDDSGEVRQAWTLWLSAWKQGKPYEDHSLDDFD